jgi:hypothetical protein
MGKSFDGIDDALRAFIGDQPVFFVATAPLAGGGHINLSPKGLDTLRVLGSRELAYLDYVGSGAETIAHLRENGRITLMMCTFEGSPRVVRFHGRGHVVEPQDSGFAELRDLFPAGPGVRAVIRIAVERISDSCGFGVPLMTFERERSQLTEWAARKGEPGLVAYQEQKNRASIDDLPTLRWITPER